MPEITKEMIIREIVERHPQTLHVFGRYQIDFCCGGNHSIEQTLSALHREAILGDLLYQLNQAAGSY